MDRSAEDVAAGPGETGAVSRRLRVVQWTTGKTGSAAVRGMAGHPVLELVGCFAYSPDKVGKDVGELCGIEPIGITATDDVEALLALQPDCVVYTAYRPNFDHLERILESGANVVSTMYMLAGRRVRRGADAAPPGGRAARRHRRCTRAASTRGTRPWWPWRSAPCAARIERLSMLESLDIQEYANEQMFRAQGFDLEPDDPEAPEVVEASVGSFKDQVPGAGQGPRRRHRRPSGSERRSPRRTTTPTSGS